MYLWREIYSKSTYSSAILFDPPLSFFTKNDVSLSKICNYVTFRGNYYCDCVCVCVCVKLLS